MESVFTEHQREYPSPVDNIERESHPDEIALRRAYFSIARLYDTETAESIINELHNEGVVFRCARWFEENYLV